MNEKMNGSIENIKSISDNFEKGMKIGYNSLLILLVLEQKPNHGYLICKEISKRTLGVWNPSVSTIYPLLESLKNRDLVKCTENIESGRLRKIYTLEQKGKDILKILIQKFKKTVDAIFSLIFSTIVLSEDRKFSKFKSIEELIIYPTALKWLNTESPETKVKKIKFSKNLIKKTIIVLKENLLSLEKTQKELEKKFLNKK